MVRVGELDLGQVVMFRAYKTMTIFCGIDSSRIKSVLLWSENSGIRWITKKWFMNRYAKLGYEIIKFEDGREVKKYLEYKGLVCAQRDINAENLEKERRLSKRHYSDSELQSEITKSLFLKAVNDATKKFESGEIEIYSPPIMIPIEMCQAFLCLFFVIAFVLIALFILN